MIEFLGVLFLIVLFILFPHTVGSIILGCFLGGAWWIICIPLALGGIFMDLCRFLNMNP